MTKNGKVISVYINHEDLLYLKQSGIKVSTFLRQSVKAHQDKKFSYSYV